MSKEFSTPTGTQEGKERPQSSNRRPFSTDASKTPFLATETQTPQDKSPLLGSRPPELISTPPLELSSKPVPPNNVDKGLEVKKFSLPTYNPTDQIRVSPTDEKGNFGDPVLHAIACEQTRASRTMEANTGIPKDSLEGLRLEWAVKNTHTEVGEKFDVHGVAKGGVKELDALLTHGLDPDRTLYTMPFIHNPAMSEAFGADKPKTEGGIYLISDHGKRIAKGNIKFVGVGEGYSRVIDCMQKKWPQVTIVPWHELPKALTQRAQEVTGKTYSYGTLKSDNLPVLMPISPFADTEPSSPPPPPISTNPATVYTEDVW